MVKLGASPISLVVSFHPAGPYISGIIIPTMFETTQWVCLKIGNGPNSTGLFIYIYIYTYIYTCIIHLQKSTVYVYIYREREYIYIYTHNHDRLHRICTFSTLRVWTEKQIFGVTIFWVEFWRAQTEPKQIP